MQLHAAHGYLFSQFLSPRSNVRDDAWGGDLVGRARFLLESVRAVRARVGADFPIGIKLNSADFQRGGFDFEDSQTVVAWLDAVGVDLIEISGGTYEQPSMTGAPDDGPARAAATSQAAREREAYFARFGAPLRRQVQCAKLMVTGGFRTAQGMADAIADDGFDLIGLARPLCLAPDAAAALLAGERIDLAQPDLRLGPGWLGPRSPIKLIRTINSAGATTWYNEQIARLAMDRPPDPGLGFAKAFVRAQTHTGRIARDLKQAALSPMTK